MSITTVDNNRTEELKHSRAPLVRAENLGVYYAGDKEKRDDFKSYVHGLAKGRRQNGVFWALRDLSFEAYSGDVLGVIGSNGAGKSTLCRVIAGLLRPNRGKIEVNGKVSALLSLGTGFNKELTGNENIMLNGLMLGYSKKQIKEIMPDIQEFSGLGDFLEQPLKNYSSGMKARLGFSIASSLEAEILIIDEVLGTGDMEFSERAVERMWELVHGAKLVIVVTHDADFIAENCNRALWIESGEVLAAGNPEDVLEEYHKFAEEKPLKKRKRRLLKIKKTKIEAMDEKAIVVENLSIKFKMGKKPFYALKDINFTIYEKEIVGIIGHNGAGKSTLCRALCGIYRGDTGSVRINGEIAALLSFGTGFNAQLSGYDNIYLNGMMLGIPRQVIGEVRDDIIDFSGLDDSIHKPVKHYSKGMKSRLGFSVASFLEPDIFVIDEALSAGDARFQKKAAERMQEMLEEARAVIIVSHSMKVIKKLCTRALVLEKGELIFNGQPKEAVLKYKSLTKKK